MPIASSSRAVEFFDQIVQSPDRVAAIQRLVDENVCEGEFLDYKNGIQFSLSLDALKETFSKYLSGFANSDGGVLIWGIDAPTNRPEKIVAVPDVEKMKKSLMSWATVATEPPVRGIQIEAIPLSSESKEGFVICLIPPSPWKPHQAKWPQECQKYYIRIVDNCVPAPHSLLKSLFQPSYTSRIRLRVVHQVQDDGLGRKAFIHIFVINDGPSSTKDFCIFYDAEGDGITHNPDIAMWEKTACASNGSIYSAARSIHPTEVIHFKSFMLGYADNSGNMVFYHKAFVFQCRIFAQNRKRHA